MSAGQEIDVLGRLTPEDIRYRELERLSPDEIVLRVCEAIITHTAPILEHFRLGEFAVDDGRQS